MGNRGTLFDSAVGDRSFNMPLTNNYSATTNPGVGNDFSQGYRRGSTWLNTSTGAVFYCIVDTAGAAVWEVISSTSSTPGQLIAPAGSAALVQGGAPSTASSAGNAANVAGAAGGATSGAGGAATLTGGAATAGNSAGGAATETGGAGQGSAAGGAASIAGGVGGATGTGGGASVTGGAGGATSGAGGNVAIAGGAATAGNANGGDVTIAGGALNGTGVNGVIRQNGVRLSSQANEATQNTAATLTAAQLLNGILTSNPAGAINLQLPLATAMDTALPTSVAGDSFDFTIISVAGSTNLPTVTTNTGWTLTGSVVFTAVAGNAGRFRARKTATGTWTLYRLA